MARFKKGQTVYRATVHFANNDRVRYANKAANPVQELRVIARVVDSCGAKKMTFVNRGYDSIFGRSTHSDNSTYFETAAAAFDYLREYREARVGDGTEYVTYPDAVPDDTWIDPIIETGMRPVHS